MLILVLIRFEIVTQAGILDQDDIMAHIANLMADQSASLALGMNNYIARELSPHSPHESVCINLKHIDAQSAHRYIVDGQLPHREREVCMEDASTNRATQISTLPNQGQVVVRRQT